MAHLSGSREADTGLGHQSCQEKGILEGVYALDIDPLDPEPPHRYDKDFTRTQTENVHVCVRGHQVQGPLQNGLLQALGSGLQGEKSQVYKKAFEVVGEVSQQFKRFIKREQLRLLSYFSQTIIVHKND